LDEERFLKQKAKIEWLAVGDSNTSYFHKSVKSRVQRNRIDVVRDMKNNGYEGAAVAMAFVKHYEFFLGVESATTPLQTPDLFYNQLPSNVHDSMVRVITNDEIKQVMFSIGDNRRNVEELIKSKSFSKLDDDDVVSLCCIILQLVLLGVEDRRAVPSWILRDANVRRWLPLYATEPTNEVDKKSYSIFGFTWAFKILEVFREGPYEYYTHHRRYPRVVAWSSNKKFYRHMLCDFLHGRVPAKRLIPDKIEVGSESIHAIPPTTELPKKRVGKTKKKCKNDNLSPLNLENAFVYYNVGGDDVVIMGVHDTGIYFTYENVNPNKKSHRRQSLPRRMVVRGLPRGIERYWENIRYEMSELFYKCRCENTQNYGYD
nr:hypothetical protein [Tanacetum cinerariifolium]